MAKGIIKNGIIKENPTFALFLGMCPVLATSSSLYSAIGMSVCVFLVLLLSNIVISLIAKYTPSEVRIPVYIVIIATIVTVISMLCQAYAPGIYTTLGAYLQLIVVNCIILGRAESFASKNNVVDSIKDAIGISIGFLMAMSIVAFLREFLGTGTINMKDLNGNPLVAAKDLIHVIPEEYCLPFLTESAGAFLVLGCCVAGFTAIQASVEARKAKKAAAVASKEA